MVTSYDIIEIDLNPVKGYEKGKRRPCLVISNTKFNNKTSLAWILPITSRTKRYPTDVQLKTKHNIVKGFVDCGQIRTVDLKIRPFEIVDKADVYITKEINEKLKFIIDSL